MRYPAKGASSAGEPAQRRPRSASPPQTSQSQTPDLGIASYFVWMRRHTGLSIHQTAELLQTEAEVIAALEAGAVTELPVWPETVRIVQAYAALAGVDPASPLNALYANWPPENQRGQSPGNSAGKGATARAAKAAKVQSVADGKLNRMKSAMAARSAGRLSFKLW